jgi:hypothetical protein
MVFAIFDLHHTLLNEPVCGALHECPVPEVRNKARVVILNEAQQSEGSTVVLSPSSVAAQ